MKKDKNLKQKKVTFIYPYISQPIVRNNSYFTTDLVVSSKEIAKIFSKNTGCYITPINVDPIKKTYTVSYNGDIEDRLSAISENIKSLKEKKETPVTFTLINVYRETYSALEKLDSFNKEYKKVEETFKQEFNIPDDCSNYIYGYELDESEFE